MSRSVTPLPPGCSEVDCPEDPKKKALSIMELRRCSYHDRRARLAEHINKGKHIYNIPRKNDKLFPKYFTISKKDFSADRVQQVILRALALTTADLNISAKKAVSSTMEDFIRYILKLGIQLKTYFPKNTLDPDDLFEMPNINKMTDNIKFF